MRFNFLIKDLKIKDKVNNSNRNELFCTFNLKNNPSDYLLTFNLTQHEDNSFTTKVFFEKLICLNVDQSTLHFLVNYYFPFISEYYKNEDIKQENNLNAKNEIIVPKNENNNLLFRYFCISDVSIEVYFKGRGETALAKLKEERIQKLFLKIASCFSFNRTCFELHSRLILDCGFDQLADQLFNSWFPGISGSLKLFLSIAKGNLAVKRLLNLELIEGKKKKNFFFIF